MSAQIPILQNWTGYARLEGYSSSIPTLPAAAVQTSSADDIEKPVVQKRKDAGQFQRAIKKSYDHQTRNTDQVTESRGLNKFLPFSHAAEIWLEQYKRYIGPRTYDTYRQYAGALTNFFKDIPLNTLQINDVRDYQTERNKRAGALRVNGEIQSVLKPILKEINRWERIALAYHPLPVPKKKVRQNMSEDQERRLLAVALDPSKPKRLVAGHCLIVMANTPMGFGELRYLKQEDVILTEERPFVTVNEGTKNDFRIRTIPLNFYALRSLRWLVKRWEQLGGTEPDHYILPHHARRSSSERAGRGHRRKSPPDFYTPMGHIYRAARAILKEAGLEGFVPYDMRSHAITKILSDPNASEQMVRELIGHSNTRTRDRYSKQRLENKAAIMDRACLEQEPAVKLIAAAKLQPAAPEAVETVDKTDMQSVLSEQPAISPAATNILMNELIQAEIARQVAMALQAHSRSAPQGHTHSGLVVFPGKKVSA
jgi:integrase